MILCSIKKCKKLSYENGYCKSHYLQTYNFGKIITQPNERTIQDPNEFVIGECVCWIVLRNNKNIEVARAKFDNKYYEQIKNFNLKWHLNAGYARADWYDKSGQQQQILLHQLIVQLSGQKVPDGHEIDHKDRDKLNCLEGNLRFCKHVQNMQNRKKHKNNTSGYKGVSWSKSNKKWCSQIMVNSNPTCLGYFDDPIEAAKTYNDAAIKYFGEFAMLNDI